MAARRMLGQILKEQGAIHEGMIQEALQVQRDRGGRIGEVLLQLGHIQHGDLARALAAQAGLEFWDLEKNQPSQEAVAKVDLATARAFGVLPVRLTGKKLVVVLADPVHASMLQDLAFTTGCEIEGAIADEALIQSGLDKFYREDAVAAKDRMSALVADLSQQGTKIDLEDKAAMAAAAPVVKLLNYILYQAIRDKASDIHLEPFENDFKIRYRVDGALFELEAPPPHLAEALIARVKVMADLDIAETRLPQDGRIELTVGGRSIDLRISTLPTMFGESTVLRVLDRSVVSLDLENLGIDAGAKAQLRKFIDLPHGIVLVTGPTGSGKTTTLYAMLNEANREDVKIITVEDPVEYDLEGIVQIPVHEDIEVTYSKVLRTILRQDPDVILVGEIRDQETAQTAIEASLTGHLVFSTLHTNDAPSAITRLVDIGIEPFLLTATLQGILAQRLVRRVCVGCKEFYEPSDEVLRRLGLDAAQVAGKKFARGKGCNVCNFTGHKGRMAIHEILVVDDRIRELMLSSASTSALAAAALEAGMEPLRASGLRAVFEGTTSVEELLREAGFG
ncbi:type IV fimbrial assembly protein PilB [Planctomycetota bacterium]|jgi:type IV pilus assembly protein PilB|nr:GspE/PulE family protein [Planctomycetota bacterium]GDY02099.1 type IV fimbrial assembly protein PilB [Planctomycetota bacterium]